MKRAALRSASLFVAAALWSASTRADPAASALTVEATSLLGERATALTSGWNGLLVRIHNGSSAPARGHIEVASEQLGRNSHDFRASAPFSVGAGSGIFERLPVDVAAHGDIFVTVTSETGETLAQTHLRAAPRVSVTLFEISEVPRLKAALRDVAIAPTYLPSGSPVRGTTLTVIGPPWNALTGDPILPEQAAVYASVDAALVRSDVLCQVTGAELDALAGYVLAGGTLAITIARPEDLRHPTLVAFAGGPMVQRAVSAATLAPFSFAAPSDPSSGKRLDPARDPSSAVSELLEGHSGGNLRGSPYGDSATYGLGEVHFLAFDPTRRPFLDDPWVQARVVDLARRAFDRRSSQVFRPGGESSSASPGAVRRQLDPPANPRWTILAAAFVLCVYSILAGPLNFGLASRARKPLCALRWLPFAAAAAFACVVAIGVAAKGTGGRSRHLTLIEAGGGMPQGSARRYRGFFAYRLRDSTIRSTDSVSVTSTVAGESTERRDHLAIDGAGARLVDVAALPWQTVAVREDGFASLGEGIALVAGDGAHVTIANRSGRPLRAAILRAPSGAGFYFPRIDDGDRASTASAVALAGSNEGRLWEAQTAAGTYAGSIELHRLAGDYLGPLLNTDAPGLAEAWLALDEAAGPKIDWFPEGVPTLIGQLDGGEGRTSDSCFRLESDRVLVRVVGFGGKP